MGELDSYDWWWNVALQGVAGSVVGAIAAVMVLLLGFRLEHRRRRDDQEVADARALVACSEDLRQLVEHKVHDRGSVRTAWANLERARQEFRSAERHGTPLGKTIQRQWEPVERHLPKWFFDDTLKASNPVVFIQDLKGLETHLQWWLLDRRTFERLQAADAIAARMERRRLRREFKRREKQRRDEWVEGGGYDPLE